MTLMLTKLIAAHNHFICLLNGEFENRHFSITEALVEVYYEFFAG
jgi:hypothetical protein